MRYGARMWENCTNHSHWFGEKKYRNQWLSIIPQKTFFKFWSSRPVNSDLGRGWNYRYICSRNVVGLQIIIIQLRTAEFRIETNSYMKIFPKCLCHKLDHFKLYSISQNLRAGERLLLHTCVWLFNLPIYPLPLRDWSKSDTENYM